MLGWGWPAPRVYGMPPSWERWEERFVCGIDSRVDLEMRHSNFSKEKLTGPTGMTGKL